jgi:hypothetical protein
LLAANPSGKVPAIRDGEVAMGESTAIMHYVTQKHGPTPLALQPDHGRYADYVQFLIFGEASMAAFLNPVLLTQFTAPEDQKQNFTVDAAKNIFRIRLKSLEAQLAKGDHMAGTSPPPTFPWAGPSALVRPITSPSGVGARDGSSSSGTWCSTIASTSDTCSSAPAHSPAACSR